VPRRA